MIDQNQSLSIDRYVTEPPVAVLEILSPEDSMVRVMAKLEEYSDMGIGQIWLIHPEDGMMAQYRTTPSPPGEHFSVPSPRIDLALSEIKALFPKRRL